MAVKQAPSSPSKLVFPSDLYSTSAPISPGVIVFNIRKLITGALSADVAAASSTFSEGLKKGVTQAAGDTNPTDTSKNNKNYTTVETTVKNGLKTAGELFIKFATARIQPGAHVASIFLYMPPSIQINDSINYETIDTKGFAEALATGLSQGMGSSADKLASGGAAHVIARSVLDKYARSSLPGSGAAANALIAEGIAPNPATKLMFKGPMLRQLQLEFKLTPRSQKEAQTISSIISAFRTAAYPTIDQAALGALYTAPDIFEIEFRFRNQVNPYMIQYKRMFLTQVTTTYNGGGVAAFFEDGSPIETNLTLTFQETELNSATDVHKGYSGAVSGGVAGF